MLKYVYTKKIRDAEIYIFFSFTNDFFFFPGIKEKFKIFFHVKHQPEEFI